MLLLDPYYSVCERVSSGLLGEPLNLLSSALYFLAAWLLWRDYKLTHKGRNEERLVLIGLLALIGLSSTAFHAAANRLTLYADTASVSLFLSLACYITLRRMLGLSVNLSRLGLVALCAVIVLTNAIPAPYRLNESVGYLPVLGGVAFIAWRLRGDARVDGMWLATALLASGLAFRSIDLAVCPSLPVGTFFLWRLCEVVTLYLVVRAIFERRKSRRSAGPGQ